MLTKDELPDCPVATTLKIFGGKWKMLILRNLLERPHRFNELKKSLPEISKKALADTLRELEADGIITRKIFEESPIKKVEYSLSDFGESARPIIQSMHDFGIMYKKTFQPATTD